MAESGHDYLEILPDETEVAMNRPSVEIPLLRADSGKYTGDLPAALDDTDVRFCYLFVRLLNWRIGPMSVFLTCQL